MRILRLLLVCLISAGLIVASDARAKQLYKEGRRAEQDGDVVRAYLLYSLAASENPKNKTYWARSHALRTQAALKAKPAPAAAASLAAEEVSDPADSEPDAWADSGDPGVEIGDAVTEADLAETKKLLPPPDLKGSRERKTLNLSGDAKAIFTEAAAAYGLDLVFDGDYQSGPPLRVRIEDADFRTALRQLEAATGSFVVVLGERLFMVVKDTLQKRAEMEPTIAVTVPIPNPVSIQEAQELARSVQQTMEITKFAVDSQRRLIFMRDRISKVRPAEVLLDQLFRHRPQVSVELQIMEVNSRLMRAYGMRLPDEFPILNFSRIFDFQTLLPSAAQVVFFGGGRSLFGLGLSSAELFARMSEGSARTLLTMELKSLAGQPATFHVGDQYPIMTGGYFGYTGTEETFTPPPSFNFTDLGLGVKFVPYVHGTEDVTLDLEANFKLLTGTNINGIPVISNRQLASRVRLKGDEWAMVAGLMSASEARMISGLAGLSSLPVLGPLFRQNETTKDETEAVILVRPKIVNLPPGEEPTPAFYVGSEARMRTPL